MNSLSCDPVGNRHLTTHVYDAANRLLDDGTFTYTYDPNGNRRTKTEQANPANVETFTYDAENQLISFAKPGMTATYAYDALGRRIQKSVNGLITRYVYDQEDILQEYDGANVLQARFTHGPGIDEPLIMERGGTSLFYHTDGLGSTVALTNPTGAVVERYRYESFGNPTILGPGPDGLMDTPDDVTLACSAYGNPYLFTGREYDCESGLYYYRARYYDPKTGTFVQEDPIKFFGGVNFYTYALNNPVTLIDPLGLGPIKDNVKESLKKELGSHLPDGLIERAATAFEKEAERLGKADNLISNSLNPFRSKEKKQAIQEQIGQEILDSLRERAKENPELRELQDKLDEAVRKKELEKEKEVCPVR